MESLSQKESAEKVPLLVNGPVQHRNTHLHEARRTSYVEWLERILLLALVVVGLIVLTYRASDAPATKSSKQPNIVVIITDDQDAQMDSMDYMAGVQSHLISKGTTYTHHYCTVALCCPSRVNLWTGKAAHNTNITDLFPPYGGYPKFASSQYNGNWVFSWLQKAGYKTYYTGKLMNAHTVRNYNKPPTAGLDGHDFLLEPGTYSYRFPTYQRNNEPPRRWRQYTTDLLTRKSLALIDEGVKSGSPFFIAIAPVAPHAAAENNGWGPGGPNPPVPADHHANLFNDVKVPRRANFNPDTRSGGGWVAELPKLTERALEYNDEWYRMRLRTLQSVDELVNKTIGALESHGILDDTYIVYTSDNGFHLSQHRLNPGKRCPYEEDINVPLVIRGPGIQAGATADFVTSHTDLAPTFVEWADAGAYAPNNLDGKAIPPANSYATEQNWEHIQVEHWGATGPEGRYGHYPFRRNSNNNTYHAIRVVGSDYSFFYSTWCNNEKELYDMSTDAGQMHNLVRKSKHEVLGVSVKQLRHRLDTLLLVLKSCEADSCTDPWSALHPDGGVNSLKDALHEQYDSFYKKQPRVQFRDCMPAYFKDNEQPLGFHTFEGNPKLTALGERETWDIENWLRNSD